MSDVRLLFCTLGLEHARYTFSYIASSVHLVAKCAQDDGLSDLNIGKSCELCTLMHLFNPLCISALLY